MIASLQCALKTDSPSGGTVATAGNAASSAWVGLSDVDGDVHDSESEGSDSDVEKEDRFPGDISDSSASCRHPRAFSTIVCEERPPTDSYVNPKP